MIIDIKNCLEELKKERPVFASEADFQFSLGWKIKELYEDCSVVFEFPPKFSKVHPSDKSIHIDIVVAKDGKYMPIELKYKTAEVKSYQRDGITFNLKKQGAGNLGCYDYLFDIERIEKFRSEYSIEFEEGYAIFLTNDLFYLQAPKKKNCDYAAFSIHKGANIKPGTKSWLSIKNKRKAYQDPVVIKSSYRIEWEKYSELEIDDNRMFFLTIAKINQL